MSHEVERFLVKTYNEYMKGKGGLTHVDIYASPGVYTAYMADLKTLYRLDDKPDYKPKIKMLKFKTADLYEDEKLADYSIVMKGKYGTIVRRME